MTGRIVVVTGGSSGIGRATAAAFARQDDTGVVIIGRRKQALHDTAEALGDQVDWVQADVARRKDVTAAVAEIMRRHRRIDVLVNNAGFFRPVTTTSPVEDAEREWTEVLGSNLTGSFLMARTVAAHLPRPGGRIVNVSSIAAFHGGSGPGSIAYASAKAGVLGLTYSLARELSGEGITTNAVAPGFVPDTGFFGGPVPEERMRRTVAVTPAGRPGRPEDVAAAIVYLASPEASFVTGEVLNVNGGWVFGH